MSIVMSKENLKKFIKKYQEISDQRWNASVVCHQLFSRWRIFTRRKTNRNKTHTRKVKAYSVIDIKKSISNPPRVTEKYKGTMIYDHKTAGTLQIMSPNEYDGFKKVTSRKGQSSVLRNVLDAGGRLQWQQNKN